MEMGNTILQLRKGLGLTQEQLADQCGVTYQAVSKWENGNAYPDITLIPHLAQVLQCSLQTLFGLPEAHEKGGEREVTVEKEVDTVIPWEDDGKLRFVYFDGRHLVDSFLADRQKGFFNREIIVEIQGPAKEIICHSSITCDEVFGNIQAGSYVECDNVNGNVIANAYVECDQVIGNVTAGAYVECDNVQGDVIAGSYVEADIIYGNAKGNN